MENYGEILTKIILLRSFLFFLVESNSMDFFIREYEWLAFVGSIISFLIGIVVLFLLIEKRKSRPNNLLSLLIFAILFLALAPLIDFVVFTIARLEREFNQSIDLTQLGTVLSFSANAIANMIILKFIQITFYENEPKKYLSLYFLQGMVIPLAFIAYLIRIDIIAPLLLHVVISLIIYSLLGKNAFYLRSKIQGAEIKDEISRNSLLFMGLSGFVMVLSIGLFVSHEILLLIPVREYITVALGWVSSAVAAILIYIGYATPEWIKQKWLKNKEKNN